MYSSIAKHILYPLGEALLGTNMLQYLKQLEDTQWWSQDQLLELQNERLRYLIGHAYRKVPYYRRLFDELGLAVADIKTVEDLSKLPILIKDEVRKNWQDMIAIDSSKKKRFLNYTGGTTGRPLKYYVSLDAASMKWAAYYRSWSWAGYKLGDKRVTLAGSSLVPKESQPLHKRLRWLGERDHPVSAVHMDSEKMYQYAKKIVSLKPSYLRGYPSALYIFAKYLEKNHIDNIRPKAVFTTAEMLLPHYRDMIEKQFACQVFDNYGCYDGGVHASECNEHSGYHIATEMVVLEFVDKEGNPVPTGQAGDILATDLYNYSMPFIRYKVEDRGTPSKNKCPCGRGLPLISSLQGRTTDIITFDNGVTLSGPALTLILSKHSVQQYQVIQEERNRIKIKIVKDTEYTHQDHEGIMRAIQSHVGDSVIVLIEYVETIPVTESGKYKFIITRVDSN